jgi:hypothetical protein
LTASIAIIYPYRTAALKTSARELGKGKLDFEGVQGVRWEKGGTERALGRRKWGSSVRDRLFRI